MNNKDEKEPKEREEPSAVQTSAVNVAKGNRIAVVAIVAIVAIAAVAVLAVLLWPGRTGKPVPAPRSVSFGESSPQTTATGGQVLTLESEQVQRAGLKIETIGEKPSTDVAGQITTGVIQANSYKETPVVSIVGGIVRNVSVELGQNVKRGQRVAVVFSNDLADAQSRYLCYYMQEKGLLIKFYQEFHAHQKQDPSGFNTLQKVLAEADMDAFKTKWEKYVLSLRQGFEVTVD